MSGDWNPPGAHDTGTGFKWLLWLLAVIAGASLLIGAFNFLGGWVSKPAQIYSVDNVQAQWQFAYDYGRQLEAAAQNTCQFEAALARATTVEDKSQRESQLLATENNYDRIAADYNARLQDAFRAKLVRPPDVPEEALTLSQMQQRVCTNHR